MKSANWNWPNATKNAASWPSSPHWSATHRDELKYGVENLAVLDLAFAKAKYAEETAAPASRSCTSRSRGPRRQDVATVTHAPTCSDRRANR